MESLRIAWRAGRRELTVMLAMQLVTIFGVVGVVLLARSLLAGLVEEDRANESVGELVPQILGLAAVTVGLGFAQAVHLHRQRLLAELSMRYAEDRVLAVTGSVELAAFDQPPFHDAVGRAYLAVQRLPAAISGLGGLLRALAGAVGAVVGLVILQPLFTPLVALVVVPSWLAARQRGRLYHRFATSLTPRDRERRYLAETLTSRDPAKEVRAYGLPGFLRTRHGRLWDERLSELREVAGRQLRFTLLADVAVGLILGAALFGLVALTLSGDATLAEAGAAAATIVLLAQRLTAAASSVGSLSEAALFIDDYLALVAVGTGEPEPGSAAPAPAPAPMLEAVRVRARDVTFSYAGAPEPVLRGISLDVDPGEVVALVGENGSGKTTLAKLLAGLYVPDGGSVTWNGLDTSSADRDELRRGVAVIFQDFQRYALTARDNIALGRHESHADDDAVRRAATVAGAHADLVRLPLGYDTMLGPAFHGGVDLSLGQWQRVALARAVFRDAPFVILDEPTAALDAQAEHDLFASIRELLTGRSVLLISHRFSSVRSADRIHVMHRGEIVETGTHDELMAREGRYARLFRLQAAPYR